MSIEQTIRVRRLGYEEPWLPDSFMAELPSDSVRQLERHGRVRRDIGSIALTGDAASVIIVLNGAIKVFRSYSDGMQALVHVAGHGDVLNAEALFTSRDVPNAALAAGRGAAVLTVPRRRFGHLVNQHEDIRHSLMRSFARGVQEHDMWRGHVGRTVDAKVWAFLVGLARRHGRPLPMGTLLSLGLTQPEIASALGVSLGSVENAMRALRIAGRLRTSRASVVLHGLPSEEELDQYF